MDAQLLLQGLASGAVYALVALGLVLVRRATAVVNVAYGDLLMAAAFIGWGLIASGWPFWLAGAITIALMALAAWLLDAHVVRRMSGQSAAQAVLLMLGLALMIRGAVSMAFGPESRSLDAPWSRGVMEFSGARFDERYVAIIAVAVLVGVAVYWLLRAPRIRAVVSEPAAEHDFVRCAPAIWALAGAIAAAAGLLLASATTTGIGVWLVMLKGMAAMAIAPVAGVPGVILGGFFIGIGESIAIALGAARDADMLACAVLVVALACIPQGVNGRNVASRD